MARAPLAAVAVLTTVVVLISAGVAGAFLNTAASSGSAVTIPVLMAVGVEPVMANASNRLPIVIGCITATWRFHRAGHLPWRDGIRFSIPAILGAVLGALLASVFGDVRTTMLVTFAVALAFVLVCANPSRWLNAEQDGSARNTGPLPMALMGVVGAWAGLIAVDSGTYALAVLVLLARFGIREANGIKVMALGSAALVSLLVFWGKGDIDWGVAAWVALGSIAGALLGARLALGPDAARWVFRLLILVLLIEIAHLVVALLSGP